MMDSGLVIVIVVFFSVLTVGTAFGVLFCELKDPLKNRRKKSKEPRDYERH